MKENKTSILSKIFKLVFIALMILAIAFLAKTYAYFKVNAEKLEIFNSITELEQSHQPLIAWTNEKDANGTNLDRFNKREIEIALSSAWNLLNQSIKHKRSIGLEDRFSDSLKNQIILGFEKDSNVLVQQIDLQHNLDLHLFSFNRQLIAFKDKNVRVVKEQYQIKDGVKTLLQKFEVVNDYEIVMVLDDGKWKVEEWLKTNSKLNDSSNASTINQNNAALRAINYYPQKTPWLEFWENYSDSITSIDLGKIKELGFNSTRIFIPYETFGKGNVKQEMLDRLQNYLDQCKDKSIQVVVTLFDFPESYHLEAYPSTRNHLISILSRFKDHQAIAMWDLKNEADLDFSSYGKVTVINWLEFMLKEARTISPNQLYTIGWSNAAQAPILSKECDIVSFHYYDGADQLTAIISDLKQKTDKPIMLGEFGRTSYNAWYGPFGFTENEQARYALDVYTVLEENNINKSAYWTLYDFPEIKGSIFGLKPWINKSQQHFGILDFNGADKEVANIVTNKKSEIALTISDKIKNWVYIYFILFLFGIAFIYFLKRRFR